MTKRIVLIDPDRADARMAELCIDAAWLSKQTGINKLTIYRAIRGEQVRRSTIRLIAEALDIPVVEITAGVVQ
ncbi:MAG: hypothetical protein HGA39_09560 [Coriobacteriia bacterium]|nr:hypothetical protein [Coriobacteriia bacterium]